MNQEIVTIKNIYSQAMDPIYIGTGGYTIGMVDNTIVRDPITKIPKIPGSTVAGTWRYYSALELVSSVKEYQPDLKEIKSVEGKNFSEKLRKINWKNGFREENNWKGYAGNKIARIKCTGQDDLPNKNVDEIEEDTGHCGHCIVCKSFGFSKKDISSQGLIFFSDLNILFFPVFTRFGTKWVTSERLLKEAGILTSSQGKSEDKLVCYKITGEKDNNEKYINLGWMYLPYEAKEIGINLSLLENYISLNDIVIVPDHIISQIINSNLEVRTSVSIDPITGAAKEGALFTSEAIPRGTIFYGEIKVFDRSKLNEDLPSKEKIFEMLEDSKKYYETLGVGGMTTRGFGRMRILTELDEKNGGDKNEKS
ncbi:MAG: hypothetical protein PWP02_159 [Thermosipho sp. (in: thermotogales)]|nr:hypothetical protein [Thermosipho sp. (in: thermotogales)]